MGRVLSQNLSHPTQCVPHPKRLQSLQTTASYHPVRKVTMRRPTMGHERQQRHLSSLYPAPHLCVTVCHYFTRIHR